MELALSLMPRTYQVGVWTGYNYAFGLGRNLCPGTSPSPARYSICNINTAHGVGCLEEDMIPQVRHEAQDVSRNEFQSSRSS